jgi:hypothetical protein
MSQKGLSAHQDRLTLLVDLEHPLIRLARALDWEDFLAHVDKIRRSKVQSDAGKPPKLRVLAGAVLLKAWMRQSYRCEADLIKHFAPARYLCGLTQTTESPGKSTIWDFFDLLGEDGLKEVNEYVVKMAASQGFTDSQQLVADLTAQEAAIPYPNEVGLLSSFFNRVERATATLGGTFKKAIDKVGSAFEQAKKTVRKYRLFAKTKKEKDALLTKLAGVAEAVQQHLGEALDAARTEGQRLVKHQKVAFRSMTSLHATVTKLLPQIRSWLKTGFVAKDKIISLTIPEAYSIVRGKVGKAVEFGLHWGIARLLNGYVLGTLAEGKRELSDAEFAVQAVDDHIRLFGEAPQSFAYDRGGDAKEAIAKIKDRGVQHVGIARKGKRPWLVEGPIKERLIKERAQVEGSIGTAKSSRYGFNKPAAHSRKMMGACGQTAILGSNLNRLLEDLAPKKARARRAQRPQPPRPKFAEK